MLRLGYGEMVSETYRISIKVIFFLIRDEPKSTGKYNFTEGNIIYKYYYILLEAVGISNKVDIY